MPTLKFKLFSHSVQQQLDPFSTKFSLWRGIRMSSLNCFNTISNFILTSVQETMPKNWTQQDLLYADLVNLNQGHGHWLSYKLFVINGAYQHGKHERIWMTSLWYIASIMVLVRKDVQLDGWKGQTDECVVIIRTLRPKCSIRHQPISRHLTLQEASLFHPKSCPLISSPSALFSSMNPLCCLISFFLVVLIWVQCVDAWSRPSPHMAQPSQTSLFNIIHNVADACVSAEPSLLLTPRSKWILRIWQRQYPSKSLSLL